MKIITYGDSIFHGDGLDPKDSIPSQIGQILEAEVKNAAISGAQWNLSGRDSLAQVTNDPNVGYDVAILEFGVNNFGWPVELNDVRYAVTQTIRQVMYNDFNTDIYLSLPTPDFRWGSNGAIPTLDDKNAKGWSQNDLIDMLIEVADEWGARYYDWRKKPVITYDNATEMLQEGQHGVHPTAKGAKLLAQALADDMKARGIGFHSIKPFVTQSSPQGVTQVVANPDYVANQAANNQPTNPAPQQIKIKLTPINSSDELVGVFNSNMTLIYKSLDFSFTPVTYKELNRGLRNYINDSINELKTLLGIKFGGISFMDSDGMEVTTDGLITPSSLEVNQVISDLNTDWTILERFINVANSI